MKPIQIIEPEFNKTDIHNSGVAALGELLTKSSGLGLISREIIFDQRSIGGELIIHLTTHEELEHIFTVTVSNAPNEGRGRVGGFNDGFIVSTEWLHTAEEMDKWLEECEPDCMRRTNSGHWQNIDIMEPMKRSGDAAEEFYHDYFVDDDGGNAALHLFRLLWAMKEWAEEVQVDCIAGDIDLHACTR